MNPNNDGTSNKINIWYTPPRKKHLSTQFNGIALFLASIYEEKQIYIYIYVVTIYDYKKCIYIYTYVMCLLCCTSLRFFQLCSPHSSKSDPKSTEASKSCSQIQKFCQRNSSYSERKETSMIEGLQQLQGGSGGAEIWHRPQITFKSCDVSPLLHFTPIFPAVLAALG